ncbi:GNAT family N-acetyltransferase [Leucobacter sp. CSA2]|uniref:GNAT family N-acetyltransferase n=1 Tax=Leucobacter edaphi TaxID=2796472 RepID=A0A934UY88_9MICO|nr:GNAT family N-acetyltransferase [Leucobacter edaphi]MBK0422193.1 GNAT family N-acetyltransferase [Leucobacter edaphi]
MFETTRLRLRRPRESDVAAVFAYRSRPDVARHLSAGTWTLEHTSSELSLYARAQFCGPGDELVLLVELLETSEVVGEVGLVWLSDGSAEIGYVFNPDFGGKGLATEAVRAILDAARDTWGFARVIATTDSDNEPSRALCERLGMVRVSIQHAADRPGVEESTYATPPLREPLASAPDSVPGRRCVDECRE